MELGLTAPYSWNKYEVKTVTVGHMWNAYNPYTITTESQVECNVPLAYDYRNGMKLYGDRADINNNKYPIPNTEWNNLHTNVDVYWKVGYGFTRTYLTSAGPSQWENLTPCIVGYTMLISNTRCVTNITSMPGAYINHEFPCYARVIGNLNTITNIGQKGDFVKEVVDTSYSAYPQNGLKIGDTYYYEYKGEKTEQQQGSFIGVVHSDSPDTYPTNGIHTDGYWYVKV